MYHCRRKADKGQGENSLNHIPECTFHSRSLACKKPYGASPAGEPVDFTVYPRREHSVS